MNRFKCMEILNSFFAGDELVVISLGEMVDEWYTVRPGDGNLFVGALGCNTGVAIGLACALPHRKVICLDSDGSMLLDLGCLPVLGNERPANLTVIVWDNESYGSLYTDPPLPTSTRKNVDLAKMAAGAGVPQSITVRSYDQFEEGIKTALTGNELNVIVVKHDMSSPERELNRKRTDGVEDKFNFLRYIERSENIEIKRPCPQL